MKQLKTEIIALADYANISREGKLNISGVFDEWRSKEFPSGILRAFFVATVHGEKNKSYQLTLKMSFEGQKILSVNMESFTGENGKSNAVVELVNIQLNKPGDYTFILFHGESELASTDLKVISLKEEKKQVFKVVN